MAPGGIGTLSLGRLGTACLPALLALAGPGRSAWCSEAVATPPRLLDQHGHPAGLADHAGQLVVVLVVELRGLRSLKAWELAVRERVEREEELRFLRVADVRPGRGITREKVLQKLGNRVPEEVSILIDLEGAWREAYRLDTATPNLLLFDGDGRLVHLFRGHSSPQLVCLVAERLAEMRARGPTGLPR